jgi:hypothetical protein
MNNLVSLMALFTEVLERTPTGVPKRGSVRQLLVDSSNINDKTDDCNDYPNGIVLSLHEEVAYNNKLWLCLRSCKSQPNQLPVAMPPLITNSVD